MDPIIGYEFNEIYYEVVSQRDEKTGKMVVKSDEYVFYNYYGEEIARFDTSSEIGQVLENSMFYKKWLLMRSFFI